MGSVLGDGEILGLGLAVDGAGRGEDDALDIVLGHQLKQVDERDDIVAVVEQRFLHALSHGLGGGEVDDALDVGIFLEHTLCRLLVAQVDILKGGTHSSDFLDAVEHFYLGVGQVVYDDYLVASLYEFYRSVGADETGSSSYQDCLFHISTMLLINVIHLQR